MTDEVRDMIRKALTGEPPIGIDYDQVRDEGRRRLARRHVVITAGAALGVVAVVGAALAVQGIVAGHVGDDPAAPPPTTSPTTSADVPAVAGCVVPRMRGGFTSMPSGQASPEELAESARLTEAFGRYALPLPPRVSVAPAEPKLCAVSPGSWGTDFTLHGPAGDRAVILEVRQRAGQAPGECARFGGEVSCAVRALPGGAARISDTPARQANQPEIVYVDAWRADGTVVRVMETGSEAAKPAPRILSDDAMVAIATAPELKVELTAASSTPPAPAEPSDRRAAELTAALAREFRLPNGMSARKVPQARAEAMAFFVSQGGYKLNADLVDAAGQGNLFINLNPPAGESAVACDNTPSCRVITLPDGRKAALARNADDITLNTVAADGTQVYLSSSSRSARAEGTGTRTRPQPSLGEDDLIRIASVTGLRW